MAPTAKMEGVRSRRRESFIFISHFLPFFMQVKVSAFFIVPLSSFNLSLQGAGGRMSRKMDGGQGGQRHKSQLMRQIALFAAMRGDYGRED